MARETTDQKIARIVAETLTATLPSIMSAYAPTAVAAVTAPVETVNLAARATVPSKSASTVNDKLSKLDILSRETVTGTITKIHRSGGSAWLDATDETYYNGSKMTDVAPFKKYAVGNMVTVSTLTYAQDSEQYPERMIVESVSKSAPTANVVKTIRTASKTSQGQFGTGGTATSLTTTPVVATADVTGLAAIRRSVPSAKRPEGCPFCGGAVHGNVGSGSAANECQIRQFVTATGRPFEPWKSADLRALADWKDAQTTLRVSKGNDDDKGVDIASKRTAPVAPPVAATAAPRATSGKRAASATPQETTVTGKLARLTNAGDKVQILPVGEKFQWLPLATGGHDKIARKMLGKNVTVSLVNGAVIGIVSVPKA